MKSGAGSPICSATGFGQSLLRIVRCFQTATAALILLLFGLIGLLSSRRGSGFDQSIQFEESESLDSQLLERGVMLDRRRQAETLLMACTRAEMTRHY